MPQLRRQPLDLDDIVLREARRLREIGRVTVDGTGVSAASIPGHPEQLARAVRNLTGIAMDYFVTVLRPLFVLAPRDTLPVGTPVMPVVLVPAATLASSIVASRIVSTLEPTELLRDG